MTSIKTLTPHDEVWFLLPWYVNETASDTERKQVEQHINECVACRSELNSQRNLRDAVCESDTHDVCEQIQFGHLMSRIHASDLQQKQLANRVFSFSATRITAIAAVLCIVIMIPFANQFSSSNTLYQTLSSSRLSESRTDNEIRVIFSQQMNRMQRQALLSRVHGELIGEPNAQGVYIVRLRSTSPDVVQVLETIRQHDDVIFAEPVLSAGS